MLLLYWERGKRKRKEVKTTLATCNILDRGKKKEKKRKEVKETKLQLNKGGRVRLTAVSPRLNKRLHVLS